MTYHEKDFQQRFNLWCMHNIDCSSAFELKITKGTSLPFAALAPHQKENLLAARHRKLIWKIPDLGATNPFDSFCLCESAAYVVVQFYFRGQKEFFLIDIDKWVDEEKTSERKSLTEDRARAIGKTCLLA
jgi:hypothetical protein